MNITIAPELEKFVQAQIASGVYFSTNELVNDALLLLAKREDERQKRIQAMNEFIDEALKDDEKLYSPEEVWEELEQIIVKAEKKHA